MPSVPRRNELRRNEPRHNEHGAILVLTCIAMLALMAFTALAVDLGQRNQRLASAQHAIDAAVLTAAQHLSTHDGDHAGANEKVKEVLRQNLGIDTDAWAECRDAGHLAVTVAGDSDCISYRRIVDANGAVKYDVRVRLPRFPMSTIFGGALGIDEIDIAAAAASNGRACAEGEACDDGTGPTGTGSITTTTFRHDPSYCEQFNPIELALYHDVWVGCGWHFEDFDRETWQREVCTNEVVSFTHRGQRLAWRISDLNRFVFHWPICRQHRTAAERESFLHQLCYGSDLWEVYNWREVYDLCKVRRPGLVDFDTYRLTSTTRANTTAPPTTAPRNPVPGPGGPGTPGDSTPTSLDLSG